METKQVIAAMLKENTGRHFLDSGSAYGRHWEHNQARDFESEPEGILEAWARDGEIDLIASINVYHFLTRSLEYNEKLDNLLQRWLDLTWDNYKDHYPAKIRKFVSLLANKHSVGGLYGEGEPFSINTYNHDSLLSQAIQYWYFTLDDEPMVILQIHGGCDTRGGYTAPRVFYAYDEYPWILDDAHGTIGCTQCKSYWHTDDAYHWYSNNDGQNLEKHKACNTEDRAEVLSSLSVYNAPPVRVLAGMEEYRDRWDQEYQEHIKQIDNIIWIDDNRVPHCPLCEGKLELWI